MDYRKEYKKWCEGDVFDEATKKELLSLTDEKEIEDRFFKQLEFGTGGLRGIIGAGANRMNKYTVGRASQGLADFINSQVKGGSVAIAYDSRIMSKEFALHSALIFAANGIKSYLFEGLRPTPELSFAVRELKTTAGIVITASHNPPQYNGYKVYWSDGGQIVPPYDKLIISKVNEITDYSAIKLISEGEAKESGLLEFIGENIDKKYIDAIKSLVLNKEIIEDNADSLKIVYTPLNGSGNMPVRRILSELGFKNVFVVPEQESPDGNFPTLEYPNPEDKNAFSYALRLAELVNADIVLATDPDADRLGVYSRDKVSGEYIAFTGNMSGLLIAEYVLSERKKRGLLPEDGCGALVTTVVSSKMAYPIAREYGLTVKETLTGFKYIGEQIKLFEEAKKNNGGKTDKKSGAFEYEFGFEESYGCLVGTQARDKDAVTAVTMLCEAAAYYKSEGLTLWDVMQKIYKKYGYYVEDLTGITLKGVDGVEKIKKIMQSMRDDCPAKIGENEVLAVRDYSISQRRELKSGAVSKIDLPKSDVLYFELENDGWCCARPSGTEPKIKFYYGVKGENLAQSRQKLEKLKDSLLNFGCGSVKAE